MTRGIALIFVCALCSCAMAAETRVTLANAHIRVTLEKGGGAWRMAHLARGEGEDGGRQSLR